jgi:single-strand DNA-binding protein
MNICSFLGKLTRDPELVNLNNGKSVVNFCISVRNPSKNQEKPEMTFIDCVAWEKAADLIYKYFKKGSKILVNTSAKTETWADKETGKNRHKIKFVVQKFWYIDEKTNPDEEMKISNQEEFSTEWL